MITLKDKEALANCAKCVVKNCIHKDCFRRLAKEVGGLELCHNIVAAKQNKSEFAVVERYYDYGKCTADMIRYTDEFEKECITGKYIYNEACYDQYVTYELSFNEALERIKEAESA